MMRDARLPYIFARVAFQGAKTWYIELKGARQFLDGPVRRTADDLVTGERTWASVRMESIS